MSANSFAAQAVADGPMTIAPPSFDGHGWLVVVNLTVTSAATLIALMMLLFIGQQAWKGRDDFPAWTPVRLYRLILSLFAAGIMLRNGVEAANIWGWDPMRPAETARFLFAKRLIDPIAIPCGVVGLALSALSLPGMIEQMHKEPLPIRMWQSRRVLKNMCAIVVLCLVAAVGVVSTR